MVPEREALSWLSGLRCGRIEFLRPLYASLVSAAADALKARFVHIGRFLDSRGIDPNHYWVGPANQLPANADPTRPVLIGFDGTRYADGNPLAITDLSMRVATVRLHSSLFTALTLLAHLFDDEQALARLVAMDADQPVQSAVSDLGLDDASMVTRDVGQHAPGEHLAPTRTGWQLYLVEPYGEVSSMADCEQPAPLAFLLAAESQQ